MLKWGEMVSTFCQKSKQFAIAFANELLDATGKLIPLKQIKVPQLFFEGEYNTGDIQEHVEGVVSRLKTDRELTSLLSSFSLPLFDPQIEEMIALVLGVDRPIGEREVRWAVLSALLTPLRQSVGSCFATAPAILVHEEQPKQFLRDLLDLFTKGRLSRVFGGVEYTVPISPSPGLGDLKKSFDPSHPALQALGHELSASKKKSFLEVIEEELSPSEQQRVKWRFVAHSSHLLLKVWELTLASFVDVKAEFSRWNLYSSLGLHPEEKGGIGELIYSYLEKRLEEAKSRLSHEQLEYEIAFDQVRATESLLRNASSEQEARRLRGEHQARLFHLQGCQRERDRTVQRIEQISQFFSFLIEKIVERFQEHFQEVYDAEMQEVEATPYDDAPAGFRLLHKHGRAHVGAWSFIRDADGYTQALKDFFIAIENGLIHDCEWEEGKGEIGQLITAIVHHIRGEEFLTSAFYRMAKAHRVPLAKVPLEKMEKKPWAYTSGGTVPTLIKTYFRREGSLSEEARWVESAQDLCIFLLDTLKTLPPRVLDPFVKNPKKRMLATSPTHAFSLLPGQPLFAQGWRDKGFTYTWVRDAIVHPRLEFYQKIRLGPAEQLQLVQELSKKMPPHQAHALQSHFQPSTGAQSPLLFRQRLPQMPRVDAFLFEMLPLIAPARARSLIHKLDLDIQPPLLPMGRRPFHDLITQESHDATAALLEEEGLAPPQPLLFADSNWEKFYFSFIVSPATGLLELWRTDRIGLTGAPMREWQPFLDGSTKQSWGIFLRPHEYTSAS